MLNFDKYREKIEKLNDNSLRCGLAELRGLENCEGVKCGTCATDSLHWLVKKYEPPLLKNGDGLKPGDWIMVRDSYAAPWRKRKFLCYFKGVFYASDDNNFLKGNDVCIEVIGYLQARLPEEGE